MGERKKVRVDFRKNLGKPPRDRSWTRGFQDHGFEDEAVTSREQVNGKGDLTRRRTIIQDDGASGDGMPSVADQDCLSGRVVRIHGLAQVVETDDGVQYRCAVRRLLKSLQTDERSIIATGDRVQFRAAAGNEGMIERVEPRHGVLTRFSKGREHVLVANVDQLAVVVSLAEPALKPHLIDRYLACARKGGLRPIVCLNKVDMVEQAPLQSLIGGLRQMEIPAILTSATTGQGIDELRRLLIGQATVFSGQSGVGKSSLLNAVQPELGLRIGRVSDVNEKGKHTTTTAELIRLELGGWVVDTPGVRQLQLWDTISEEVEGYFDEFHPFVAQCAFPDCTHLHESRCRVKDAVNRRMISLRRYHSYVGMFNGMNE